MDHPHVLVLAALTALLCLATPALAQPVGTPAPPADEVASTGPLSVSGSFFSRYEMREGYGLGGSLAETTDFVRYRARFGLHTTPFDLGGGSSFAAHFEPQAGGFWHVGGNGLEDPTLGLHQGFVDLQLGETARFDVGRFEMVYGDHLVIGNVGWHHLGRAFDGLRVHLTPGDSGMWADIFVTALDEGTVRGLLGDALGSGDVTFAGAYVGLGPMIADDLDLDIYLLSRSWGEEPQTTDPEDPTITYPATGSATELTAGVRAKGAAGSFVYRFEAGAQFGGRPVPGDDDPTSVLAYQADLEVGIDLKKAAHVQATVEGFYASGDDPESGDTDEAWAHLFPTAHKWMGLMDFIGARSNIYGGVLHLVGAFAPLTVKLDTHAFFHPQPGGPAGDDGYRGTELDLNLIYALGKGVKLRGLYGQFIPESAGGFDDHLHFVELELRTTF